MNDGQMTFFGDSSRGDSKPARFSIRRSFNAPLEAVFDAWLIPYLAGSWMFGPRDIQQEVVTLENMPLPDGSFNLEVIREGRKQQLTGTYKEIRRPEKLVCTIGNDSESAPLTTLTMELTADDDKTRMKLGFELDASLAARADELRSEWSARCKALAELVERSRKQARLFS